MAILTEAEKQQRSEEIAEQLKQFYLKEKDNIPINFDRVFTIEMWREITKELDLTVCSFFAKYTSAEVMKWYFQLPTFKSFFRNPKEVATAIGNAAMSKADAREKVQIFRELGYDLNFRDEETQLPWAFVPPMKEKKLSALKLLIEEGVKLSGDRAYYIDYIEEIFTDQENAFFEKLLEDGLLYNEVEKIENIPNLKNINAYFHDAPPDILKRRHFAFNKFPCLFNEFQPDNAMQLDSDLAAEIDEGHDSKIIDRLTVKYGMQSKSMRSRQGLFQRLPPIFEPNISTDLLLELIEKTPGFVDELPKRTGKLSEQEIYFNNPHASYFEEWKTLQKVLSGCMAVAVNLSNQEDENNPFVKELFYMLVTSCMKSSVESDNKSDKKVTRWSKQKDAWEEYTSSFEREDEETDSETLATRAIRNALEKYVVSVILPILIRGVLLSHLSEDKKDQFNLGYWANKITPTVAEHLFKKVPLHALIGFAKEQSTHPIEVRRNQHKLVVDTVWDSLIPLDDIPPVPEALFGENGWHIVPITSTSELIDEAEGMSNCIREYHDSFAYGNRFLFSVRDSNGKSKAGIIIDVNYVEKSCSFSEIDFEGVGNIPITINNPEYKIMKWFLGLISRGDITINFDQLQRNRDERRKPISALRLAERAKRIIRIDSENTEQTTAIDRDFRAALNQRRDRSNQLQQNFDTLQEDVLTSFEAALLREGAVDESQSAFTVVLGEFIHSTYSTEASARHSTKSEILTHRLGNRSMFKKTELKAETEQGHKPPSHTG